MSSLHPRPEKRAFSPSPEFQARYQSLTPIGDGGSGEVYRAWDSQEQRDVAIKWIKTKGVDDSVLANPWGEAHKLAATPHPNIVSVYDTGQDQMVPFIVMEFIEGETVDDSVQRGVFTVPEFAELATQALEGLNAAHRAGLIHRDLKPENIMLTAAPDKLFQIKLLDFGMAKFLTTPRAQTINLDGTMAGSICWISPEQVLLEPVDTRCDLYSLGCVFYYALSGQHPFDGRNSMAILDAKLEHRVIPLEKLCPDIPRVLAQWVMAMINFRPEHRYQNGTQALAVLRYLLAPPVEVAPAPEAELPVPQTEDAEPLEDAFVPTIVSAQPALAPRRRVTPWALMGLAAGLVLLSLVLLWLIQ